MKEKQKSIIDDKAILRAFVTPELFPFILEIYIKNGKTEESLNEDIKIARTKYKEIVSLTKQKAVRSQV